jgi:cytochrome c-type biogenesis protein CcmF
MFLTVGIALGSFWAYYELGWGGWWFWDPVENASFMPWLVGTALIHSLAITEKRGGFKSWTVLLAIFAFSLSLLGTFLVRSGVLTSVHAFATDPKRGIFILMFLAVVIGSSLFLFALRAPKVGLGGSFGLVSRESLLLSNNVLLSVAAASVMLGTLYPLFLDALGMGKISVGPPYFESVFVPLMTPVAFLMGIGPMARWKQASLPALAARLKWALGIALVTAAILPVVMGTWKPLVAFGVLLAAWVIAATITVLVSRLRSAAASGTPLWQRLRAIPRAHYGMVLAHIGVGVFILGVTMVKGYETEKDVKMRVGDTADVGSYQFRFMGAREISGPNYTAWRGTIEVTQDGNAIATMTPEKRFYTVQRMPMTEAAIERSIFRDMYVSMGEPVGDDAWVVQLRNKPLVNWIWVGCLIMALGGFFAASDRRYRLAMRREQQAQTPAIKGKGGKPAPSPVAG